MNINTFYYFSVLAKELNMTRAAEKLNITQQALSAQILRLEKNYNVELFKRTPHLELTYSGKRFLEYCNQLNTWNSKLEDELREIGDGEKGQIFIGATAKRGFSVLPWVFPKFHYEYPQIEVCMVESTSPELITNLINEKTDFCIIVSETENPDICSIPVSEEQSLLFISDTALAKFCPEHYEYLISNKHISVPISYFKNCPFILNSPGNRVRKKCDDLFATNGIVPNIIFSSANAMNLAQIASLGIGAAFLNSSTREESIQKLHRFKIEGLSDIKTLKVSYLRNRYLSKPARRFIEIIREEVPKDTTLPQQSILEMW